MNSRAPGSDRSWFDTSGTLGHYVMDHIFRTGVSGEIPGMTEYIEYGRRPGAVYVPRFRNIDSKDDGVGFKRGYGFQGRAGRPAAWPEGFGAATQHGLQTGIAPARERVGQYG